MSDARKSGKGAVIKASLSYSQWKFGSTPGTNFPAYNFCTRSGACPYFFSPQTLCRDGTNDFKADNTSLCFPSVVPLRYVFLNAVSQIENVPQHLCSSLLAFIS